MYSDKINFLTIDLEDWFHILDVKELANEKIWSTFESRVETISHQLLDLLDTNSVKATFFCLGWIVKKYPNLIKEIANRGHEIGTHSYMHHLVYTLDETLFKEDTKKSIDVLQDTIGKPVDCYRAPGFSIGKDELWALDILIELGIKVDSSIFPGKRSHGGFLSFPSRIPVILNRSIGSITEFPISTKSHFGLNFVVSGGGYFRLLPYFFTKYILNKFDYNLTYFHPRDFDFYQPRFNNLGIYKYFKTYVGLKYSLNNFKCLLKDFNFLPLMKYYSQNTNSFKTIDL